MAVPTIIGSGAPDLTTTRNVTATVDTSQYFEAVGAPAINYELRFDNAKETAIQLPATVNFTHPCTFKAKFRGTLPLVNNCMIGSTGNFQMRLASNDRFRVDYPDGLGGFGVTQTNLLYPSDGTEYEFEVRFTSGRVELWVDGVLDKAQNVANDPTDFNINWLGRMNNGGNDLSGVLKDVDLNGVATYPINDGPGATVIADSVGAADATPVNITSGDWQEAL